MNLSEEVPTSKFRQNPMNFDFLSGQELEEEESANNGGITLFMNFLKCEIKTGELRD